MCVLCQNVYVFELPVLFLTIGGQYRGTFLVPVPSVLLWYWYRGTLLFLGGTGTLVLFYFLVGILRT